LTLAAAAHQARRLIRHFPARSGSVGLLRSRGGLAGLEFALLAPVLVTMLAGLYDLTLAYIAYERVNLCAQTIGQIATIQAAGSTATNTLSLSQATASASAAYAYLPKLLNASPPAFGVTISSVVMTPTVSGCSSGCTYTAHVAWSGIYEGAAGLKRPCDTTQGASVITQSSDTAATSPTTLPSDVYSAAPLVVVDVTYQFTPLFFKFITSSFTIVKSAYLPPRSGITNNWLQYVFAAPDSTTLCPGYPSA
jgi:Flp pilus assembly protein TadG